MEFGILGKTFGVVRCQHRIIWEKGESLDRNFFQIQLFSLEFQVPLRILHVFLGIPWRKSELCDINLDFHIFIFQIQLFYSKFQEFPRKYLEFQIESLDGNLRFWGKYLDLRNENVEFCGRSQNCEMGICNSTGNIWNSEGKLITKQKLGILRKGIKFEI